MSGYVCYIKEDDTKGTHMKVQKKEKYDGKTGYKSGPDARCRT